MSPLVKETAGNEPAVNASRLRTVAVADEAARPQPVCIEVPITIQGVRAAKAGEKREPFTESTRTVIVFANGAVVRLAAPVNAGQPLFLTNERTHKEIVCQVVKSRTYASVPGYVEIEFTEPSVGFWGMRFPSDQVQPEPESAPEPPSSARPVTPPASSATASPMAAPPAPASSLPPSAFPAPQAAEVMDKATPPAPPVRPAPVAEAPAPAASSAPPLAPPLHIAEPAEKPVPAVEPVQRATLPEAHVAPAQAAPTHVVPLEAAPAGTASSAPPLPPTFHIAEPAEKPVSAAEPAQQIIAPEAHVAPAPAALAHAAPPEAAPITPQAAPPVFRALEPVEKPAPSMPPVRPAGVAEKSAAPVAVPVESVASSTMPPARPVVHETPLAAALPPQPAHPRPLTLAPRAEEKRVQPVDSFGSQSGSVPHAPPPPLKASAPAVSEIPVFPARPRPAPGGTAHPESQGARPSEAVFSGSIFAKAKSKKEKAKAGSRSAYAGLVAAGVLLVAGGVGWHWWAHSGRLAAARRAAFVPTNNTLAAPAAEQNVVTVTANAASGKVTATLPPAVRPGELVAGAVKSEKAEKAGKKSTLAELKLSAPVAARRGAGAGPSSAPDMAPEMAGSIPSSALGELTPAQSGQPGAPIQGGQVVRPKQISIIPPQYTPLAQRQHIQGDVTLDILVDAGGRVASVKVVSGPPLLRQAAIEAVRQWKYQPGLLDGAPSPMHVTETVRFRLE